MALGRLFPCWFSSWPGSLGIYGPATNPGTQAHRTTGMRDDGVSQASRWGCQGARCLLAHKASPSGDGIMSNASWKAVSNGKTRVTLNVGLATEKRFALAGMAFSAQDVLALCQSETGLVRVRSKVQHIGGNADQKGGMKYGVSG